MMNYNVGDLVINSKDRVVVNNNSAFIIPKDSKLYYIMIKTKLKELIYNVTNIGNTTNYSNIQDRLLVIQEFNKLFDNIPDNMLILTTTESCIVLETYIKVNISTMFNLPITNELEFQLKEFIATIRHEKGII